MGLDLRGSVCHQICHMLWSMCYAGGTAPAAQTGGGHVTITATETPTVPSQYTKKDPDAPRAGQTKQAADLMRRLWGHDPVVCEELVAGLYDMGRIQLGRVVDNLMWTLDDQPRPISADQGRRIRALWGRKMSRPIDAEAGARLLAMTEDQANAFIEKLRGMPDRAM